MDNPVVLGYSSILIHAPELVVYGSKPTRELKKDSGLAGTINKNLRTYEECKNYPPHQVYIGNMKPEELWNIEKPWFENLVPDASRSSSRGEIMPQDEFYGMLKITDEFDLVFLVNDFIDMIKPKLTKHRLFNAADIERLGEGVDLAQINSKIDQGALPLFNNKELVGCVIDAHDEDDNLKADIILENLACKASGILAIRHVLDDHKLNPDEIEFVMNSGEEGVGDRYQRGAGNLAKAMAKFSNLNNSTGADVKAFCCGPNHTVVLAGGLVKSNIFKKVIVVGGGCLAKLGMKLKGHLANSVPILEDVLGAFALVVSQNDYYNPQIRLDIVGKHDVSAGSSQQAIYESLVIKPLEKMGKCITDINKFSTELHNPEITKPAGSGDVPKNNYRMIGALAVLSGNIKREELDQFEYEHGMPGFSPTQGHIPSAIPYIGHAREAILEGKLDNTMFVGKGSLFLAKMTNSSDGMSFVIEKNKGANGNVAGSE